MSGIFINESSKITVQVFVGLNKKASMVYADKDRGQLVKDNTDLDLETVEQYEVVFKQPNYQEEVNSLSQGVSSDLTTLQVNIASINYARMTSLLDSWSFKDNEGNPIPPTKENIDRLHPAVANAILDGLTDYL